MKKPNILLITVHDLGNYLGCYGFESVESPCLDRMAAEGVCFTNHFTTGVYCSPSRGSIVTGLYPHVNGLEGLVNRGWKMKDDAQTLPQLLKDSDYTSILIGFQHEAPPAEIERLGYDEIIRGDSNRVDDIVPRAIDFLNSRAKEMGPWYASLGTIEVHNPYDRYEKTDLAKVKLPDYVPDCPEAREDMAGFQGSIKHMDKRIGEVLTALDDNGLSDNTIVIFTTDHGPAWPRGKCTTYDPGLRCALLVRCPGAIEAGISIDIMTSHVDITPSILEIAGVASEVEFEGVSFAPALNNEFLPPREFIFAEDLPTRTIRTEKFKYTRNFVDDHRIVVAGWLKEREYAHQFSDQWSPLPPVELYDLVNDPLERNNLADDPEYAAIQEKLHNQLFAWLEKTDDKILKGFIPERYIV